MLALKKLADIGDYVSDRVYDGVRHMRADTAARHRERVRKMLATGKNDSDRKDLDRALDRA